MDGASFYIMAHQRDPKVEPFTMLVTDRVISRQLDIITRRFCLRQ